MRGPQLLPIIMLNGKAHVRSPTPAPVSHLGGARGPSSSTSGKKILSVRLSLNSFIKN